MRASPDASSGGGLSVLREHVERTWYRPHLTVTSLALSPLSWLFAGASAARRAAYERGLRTATRVRVPVIVVGNITVGGTGKTPVVIALAEMLRAQGHAPGVISRGYGRRTADVRVVGPHDGADDVGDEPLLMSRRGFPVAVGARRAQAATALLDANRACDVLIADDGLQHYALARDVEIVVIDGARRFGNGRLLPAGPLREPIARAGTVDAVVLTDPAPGLALDLPNTFASRLRAEAFSALRDAARVLSPDAFRGRRAHAIAGIGHPERFFRMLRDLGIEVVTHSFPDHHAYRAGDLPADAELILMTEKDAVKCEPFADERCFYLRVGAELEPGLLALIERRLAERRLASRA